MQQSETEDTAGENHTLDGCNQQLDVTVVKSLSMSPSAIYVEAITSEKYLL